MQQARTKTIDDEDGSGFEEIQGRLQWRTDECYEVKEVQEVQE
jgi:hypothetical protein